MNIVFARASIGTATLALWVLSACGGGGGGGGSQGSDNTVNATMSPSGTVLGYTGETQTVELTFTTNDGAAASALSVSGLNSMPAGWMSSGSGTCASVTSGSACALALTYTPLTAGSGAVALAFSYHANNGMAKTGTVSVPFTARSVTLKLLQGSLGGSGNLDGVGAAARFDGPSGVVADSAGNVYVSDGAGLIRKIAPDHSVTTILGSSSGDAATEPGSPFGGIAIDAADNLYIADTAASTILKLTPGGDLSTLAGHSGTTGAADGTGTAATFNFPASVAVNAAGTVYVADRLNNEIRQITPAGVVSTLAGSTQHGSADGTGAAASFWYPLGIAVNPAGMVYVADTENCTIRQITPQGVVSTLAGIVGDFAWADGTGAAAAFSLPGGMSVDSVGNLYVVDEGSIIRKITPQGMVTTPVGTPNTYGSTDGTGAAARFYAANDVAVGPGDVLYVADLGNNTIRMVSTQDEVTTIAGAASPYGPPPQGIAADSAGNVYLAAGDLLKISPQGVTSTISLQTTRPLVAAVGVAVAGDGTIYVSEESIIQKISPQGAVATIAGAPGIFGAADGTGSAARFNMTDGIAVNPAGTVYVVDSGNNTIRAITPQGVVSTLAGSAGTCCASTDGTGSSARFDSPFSLTLDGAGNLYVGEGQGVIRKITPQGVVTTLPTASAGLAFNGGTGGSNLSMDTSGNLYVADEYNQVIRKISPQNAVTTVIGLPAHVGLAVAPLPASLAEPRGVVVLPSGQLAILDGFAVLVTQGL
jgi:sugar lactone lactonase YvrE